MTQVRFVVLKTALCCSPACFTRPDQGSELPSKNMVSRDWAELEQRLTKFDGRRGVKVYEGSEKEQNAIANVQIFSLYLTFLVRGGSRQSSGSLPHLGFWFSRSRFSRLFSSSVHLGFSETHPNQSLNFMSVSPELLGLILMQRGRSNVYPSFANKRITVFSCMSSILGPFITRFASL